MKYLVAVSGGVDSVVLLDMLAQTDARLIVAHVDHGIRGTQSEADARFVAALAKQYQLPLVATELHLPPHASEEMARNARYEFLFAQAAKHDAIVATAHHRDDLVETVAINLQRGTGWRGLAVLGRSEVYRPLLGYTKSQLYAYALRRHLEWVEDYTNRTDAYARNRLRRKLFAKSVNGQGIAELRARQLQLRDDIEREIAKLLPQVSGSRYFLSSVDPVVASELLAADIVQQTGCPRPTRPRLARALLAVRTAPAGSRHDVGDGVILQFTTRTYCAKVI